MAGSPQSSTPASTPSAAPEANKSLPPPPSPPIRPWSPKQDLDDEIHSERWLLSYADFITLLMVLFMMLYALQLVKAKDLATADMRSAAVKPALEPHPEPAVPAPNPARNQFIARMTPLVDQGALRIAQDARGVELDINAGVLFNSGDARLLPQAKKILTIVAVALKESHKDQILVEGHTDSVPIATAKYESNWELSSARAGAVVRFFVDQGIEPHRLIAMGRADNVPAALGDDPEALARNRRVTILVRY
jgi:chemotaxis protein MotB